MDGLGAGVDLRKVIEFPLPVHHGGLGQLDGGPAQKGLAANGAAHELRPVGRPKPHVILGAGEGFPVAVEVDEWRDAESDGLAGVVVAAAAGRGNQARAELADDVERYIGIGRDGDIPDSMGLIQGPGLGSESDPPTLRLGGQIRHRNVLEDPIPVPGHADETTAQVRITNEIHLHRDPVVTGRE